MKIGNKNILDLIIQEGTDVKFIMRKLPYDITDVVFDCQIKTKEGTLIPFTIVKDTTVNNQTLTFSINWNTIKELPKNTPHDWYCISTSGNGFKEGLFTGSVLWN